MHRSFQSLHHSLSTVKATAWEDCVPLRWLAQISVGAVSGAFLLGLLLFSAGEPLPTRDNAPEVNLASIVPFLSATGVTESAAFHRLAENETFAAADEVQYRAAARLEAARAVPAKAIPVAEPPLAHDFSAPRTSWRSLDSDDRTALDALMATSQDSPAPATTEIILHATPLTQKREGAFSRYLAEVRGSGPSTCDILITDGQIEVMGEPEVGGAIDITIVGDFSASEPTVKQLTALDEVLDYISIRRGQITLLQHLKESQEGKSCLGPRFPIRQISAEIASDGKPG